MYLFHIFRSFVPLRNPLGFGANDLLELGITLCALIAIFGYAWAGNWLKRFARHAIWCMLALFLFPIALRLALLPKAPVPPATTSVAYSSLLLADTLLHGRLANPPHPFHQFFEAPLVSQTPAYRSTLPLAYGVLPAVGQLLFRNPWAGILLGIGALSASCYWMLRACFHPDWALCGGTLVACAFGPLSRWTNSGSGAFISAIAGCLILGALPRLKHNRAPLHFALFAAGLILELLANPPWFCLLFPIAVLITIAMLKRLKHLFPVLMFTILLTYGIHFLFWYGLHLFADLPTTYTLAPYEGGDFLVNRVLDLHRAVIQQLHVHPGQQLVFVRLGLSPTSENWIHNGADIDTSTIVWARDLGDENNRKLIDYYRNRTVWLFEPDAIPPRLRPYAAVRPLQ